MPDFYGELTNATVKETNREEDTIYEFQRRVGRKVEWERKAEWERRRPVPEHGTSNRNSMNNQDLVELLDTLPEKKLALFAIAREIILPDGSIDLEKAEERNQEIQEANEKPSTTPARQAGLRR